MLHYQVCTTAIPAVPAEPVNVGITENRGIFPSCFLCSYILTLQAKAPATHFQLWCTGEPLSRGRQPSSQKGSLSAAKAPFDTGPLLQTEVFGESL